jgi:hypothetical protein
VITLQFDPELPSAINNHLTYNIADSYIQCQAPQEKTYQPSLKANSNTTQVARPPAKYQQSSI